MAISKIVTNSIDQSSLALGTTGNVGIGTSSPVSDAKLTISSDNTESYVFLQRSGSGRFDAAIGNNSGNIVFRNGADSATVAGLTERMRIEGDTGNVGIGTSTPTDTGGFGRAVDAYSATGAAYYARSSSGVMDFGLSGTSGYIWNRTNGSIQIATNNTERMRIDSSGILLIGTTTSQSGFRAVMQHGNSGTGAGLATVASTTDAVNAISFQNSNGQIGRVQVSGTTTTYVTSSDYRLKENIAPMTGALAKISELKPVTYTWKTDGSSGQGFIAHELQEVVPEAIAGNKDEVDAEGNPVYQGIDTSFLVATLTAAIQELKAEFDEYKRTHP